MSNTKVREAALHSGVRLWEIAHALGMTDGNFSRKLRLELPDEEQKRILGIIDEIRREHANEAG